MCTFYESEAALAGADDKVKSLAATLAQCTATAACTQCTASGNGCTFTAPQTEAAATCVYMNVDDTDGSKGCRCKKADISDPESAQKNCQNYVSGDGIEVASGCRFTPAQALVVGLQREHGVHAVQQQAQPHGAVVQHLAGADLRGLDRKSVV